MTEVEVKSNHPNNYLGMSKTLFTEKNTQAEPALPSVAL